MGVLECARQREAFMSKAALCGKNGEKPSLVKAQDNGKGALSIALGAFFQGFEYFSLLTSEKSLPGRSGHGISA